MKNLLILLSFLILSLLLITPAQADSSKISPNGSIAPTTQIGQNQPTPASTAGNGVQSRRERGEPSINHSRVAALPNDFIYTFTPSSDTSNQVPISVSKNPNLDDTVQTTQYHVTTHDNIFTTYLYNVKTKEVNAYDQKSMQQYSPTINKAEWKNIVRTIIAVNNKAIKETGPVYDSGGKVADKSSADRAVAGYNRFLMEAVGGPRRVPAGTGKQN